MTTTTLFSSLILKNMMIKSYFLKINVKNFILILVICQYELFLFHPPQLHVYPGTLRAVWTAYQILSGWRGITQKEPSATMCMPKGPKVSTPAAAPHPLPAMCQIWNVELFIPFTWRLSTIIAELMTITPLISKQVFNKDLYPWNTHIVKITISFSYYSLWKATRKLI